MSSCPLANGLGTHATGNLLDGVPKQVRHDGFRSFLFNFNKQE